MADHPLTVGTRHKHVPLATTANSYTTGSNRILPHGLAVSPQSPHPSLGGLSTTLSQLARKEKKAPYRKLFDTTRGHTQRGPRFESSAVRAGTPGSDQTRNLVPNLVPPFVWEGRGPSPAFRGDARMHRCRPDPHRCQPHNASLLTDAVSILRQNDRTHLRLPGLNHEANLEPARSVSGGGARLDSLQREAAQIRLLSELADCGVDSGSIHLDLFARPVRR